MPFTDVADLPPEPTASSPSPSSASQPRNIAAVAITVGIVGVLMFALITWLVLRLRRKSTSSEKGFSISTSHSTPVQRISTVTDRWRPSFASDSSRFGFIRKPLRLAHQREDGSWDFADPDPFSGSQAPPRLPSSPTPKHRPPPLSSSSPRSKCSSTHKDEFGPRTPSTPGTPGSFDFVEPPPPAYCRDGTSWPLYQPKDLPC